MGIIANLGVGLAEMKIKVVLFVLVAAIGVGIVFTYNHAISRAIKAENKLLLAETALADTKAALIVMIDKKNELDQLLVEKQKNEQKARADAQRFEDAFNLLRKANKQVNFWAGATLPINAATGVVREQSTVKPSH